MAKLVFLSLIFTSCCSIPPDLLYAHKLADPDHEVCYTINKPKELENRRYCLREVRFYK